MFCQYCGKELKDAVAFCPNCGNPIGEHSPIDIGDDSQIAKAFSQPGENVAARVGTAESERQSDLNSETQVFLTEKQIKKYSLFAPISIIFLLVGVLVLRKMNQSVLGGGSEFYRFEITIQSIYFVFELVIVVAFMFCFRKAWQRIKFLPVIFVPYGFACFANMIERIIWMWIGRTNDLYFLIVLYLLSAVLSFFLCKNFFCACAVGKSDIIQLAYVDRSIKSKTIFVPFVVAGSLLGNLALSIVLNTVFSNSGPDTIYQYENIFILIYWSIMFIAAWRLFRIHNAEQSIRIQMLAVILPFGSMILGSIESVFFYISFLIGYSSNSMTTQSAVYLFFRVILTTIFTVILYLLSRFYIVKIVSIAPKPVVEQQNISPEKNAAALSAVILTIVNIVLHFVPTIKIDYLLDTEHISVLKLLETGEGIFDFSDSLSGDVSGERVLIAMMRWSIIGLIIIMGVMTLVLITQMASGNVHSQGIFTALIICILLSFFIQAAVFLYINTSTSEYAWENMIGLTFGGVLYLLSAIISPIVIGVNASKLNEIKQTN